MTNPNHLFEDCRVEATSVADFLDRYYKHDRYRGRGEEYAAVILAGAENDVRTQGYTIASQHESVTGKVVAYFPELHCYTNSGDDTYVALNKEHAIEMMVANQGFPLEDDDEFTEESDDRTLSIQFHDEPISVPEGAEIGLGYVRATAKAWANWQRKPGYLCGTNY